MTPDKCAGKRAGLPLLDFPDFLRLLRGEREPTMVVHGPPLCGKTRFARQLAAQTGWGYLDVLDVLGEQPEVAAKVDCFDLPLLSDLVLEWAASARGVLMVDELDFLFPLWGNLHPFQEWVRSLSFPGIAFAFFLQSRPDWAGWNLETAARQTRVVDFEHLKPL